MPRFIKVGDTVLNLDHISYLDLGFTFAVGKSAGKSGVLVCLSTSAGDSEEIYTEHSIFFDEHAAALRLYFSGANPDVQDLS